MIGTRWTRRQLLLLAVALLASGRSARPCSALEVGQCITDAARKGRRFLASMFDPAVCLLPEFRGSEVYWLYHDNYLAAKVLEGTEPDMAKRITKAIKGHGVEGSGKIEILFGEAKRPLPFRHYRLEEVKRVGDKVIKTEVVGDAIHEDWREYTDLLFMAAIAEADEDRDRAVRDFVAGLATWDGTGFKDRVNRKRDLYATFKLALALIAADKLDQATGLRGKIVERLLASQQEDGGFDTDYDAQGRTVGLANVETTSLAVLAPDVLTRHSQG